MSELKENINKSCKNFYMIESRKMCSNKKFLYKIAEAKVFNNFFSIIKMTCYMELLNYRH